MDKKKIADVLEDAARMYRDEKVQWCTGMWVEGPYKDTPEDEVVVSACAEGAILQASGYTWEQVASYEGEDGLMRARDPEAFARFQAARDALGLHLLEHQKEYFVGCNSIDYKPVLVNGAYERTPSIVAVPSWNDGILDHLVQNDPTQNHTDLRIVAKNTIIDAMETTAKDLRNG